VSQEKRRALRILLNVPAVVEPMAMPPMKLHENLAKVYDRVHPPQDDVGKRYQCVLRDLSTNGAFLAGQPVPLLTRVACSFELEGFGRVETIGWTLWRRSDDCKIPRDDGTTTSLPRGFGVLFEAIPLDARIAIHKLVSRMVQGAN